MKIRAQLDEEFDMKSLWVAKKIIGMEILMDRKAGRLYLTQKKYIEKVLHMFNMLSAKAISTPLVAHIKLSSTLCL